ncbi:MAG: hypothetical protein JW727_01010 [Candidatus Aenigmarchaeota archaeon]|nr:hypothetical protein [Candidatus Aenigmarchaeota archaeon]
MYYFRSDDLAKNKEKVISDLHLIKESSKKNPFGISECIGTTTQLIICMTETRDKEILDSASEAAIEFLKNILGGMDRFDTKDLPSVFAALQLFLIESGQYSFEVAEDPDSRINKLIGAYQNDSPEYLKLKEKYNFSTSQLKNAKRVRDAAYIAAKKFFERPEFSELNKQGFIADELLPFFRGMTDYERFRPFRVAEATKIGDKIYAFSERTTNEALRCLLLKIYDKKQIRFGTSGFRAYVGKDFTQRRSDIISLATAREVSIFQKKSGRPIIIVYDTRLGSREYAIESARVFIAQGFPVKVSREAAPTGALVYWLIEEEKLQAAAGENMTPSHNPISMQGQRLSLHNGDVAPTSVTDRVEREANLINLNEDPVEKCDLCRAERERKFQFIDMRGKYTTWIADLLKEQNVAVFDNSGKIIGRRPLPELLKEFYSKKSFIHNAMNGAARGYISEIFRKMGIYEESVFQMDSEKDTFLKLRHYGNPEERWMTPTMDRMKALDAVFEGATDPDGDRCGGVLDESGFTNLNKLMAMLIEFMVVDLDWKGHQIIRTGSTSTALDDVIVKLTADGYDIKTPEIDMVNSLVRHPFYNLVHISDPSVAELQKFPCVVTEVGFKYISAAMKKYDLPAAVAGEESGGFSIKRFPDKDGIVGLCLVASMVAQRNMKPGEMWKAHMKKYGTTFDKRVDLWVPNYPKEKLINYWIDNPPKVLGEQTIKWIGGTKNDKVELVMEEAGVVSRLVVRASGTEEMNRLYLESKSEEVLEAIEKETLLQLRRFVLEDIEQTHSYFELAEKVGAFGTSYLDEAGKKAYFETVLKKMQGLAAKHGLKPIEVYRKVLNLLTYGMDRDANVRHVAWGSNIGEELYHYLGGTHPGF